MSLLSKLRAALAVPATAHARRVGYLSPYDDVNHLYHFVAPDWFPHRELTREIAMGVPAVSRSRRIVCNTIAQLPLQAYRGDQKIESPTWLDRADGPISPYQRMVWTVDDLFFYGLSLWAVDRNDEGRVLAADRVPFDEWTIDGDGRILWIEPDGSQTVAAADSVILIQGADDGLLHDSAGPIRHAADLLRNAAKAAENPAAYIDLHQTNDTPITPAQRDEMRAAWQAARRGENGGVAFTSAGVEARELGAPIAHLLVEGRNAAALDVARAAGLPGIAVDANNGSSMTYDNAEARFRDLLDFGLSSYMAPIVARLSLDDMCPRGTRVAFDLDAWLPGATEATPDDGGASTRPRQTSPNSIGGAA